MRTQRCRKCNVVKGKPHTSNCPTRQYSSAYPDSLKYTYGTEIYTGTDSGSSGSCDTGSSSSSDSGGGGGCE